MRRWQSKHYLSEVSGSKGLWEAPVSGTIDGNAADVDGTGYWNVSESTGVLDWGHRASTHVDYEHFREVRSTAASLFPSLLSISLVRLFVVFPVF